jgi:hypothetical protein
MCGVPLEMAEFGLEAVLKQAVFVAGRVTVVGFLKEFGDIVCALA